MSDTDPALPELPGPPARVVKLKLDRKTAAIVRRGHPWLYAGSAPEPKEGGPAGSFVTLYDERNAFLATGLWDPVGAIRVRVFQRDKPRPLDRAFFAERLREAAARRATLAASGATTGYRVLYGESDGLPGAVLDRYDRTLVAKLYTPAWVPHLRALLGAVHDELSGLALERIVLRLPRTVQARAAELAGLADGAALLGEPPAGPVVFRENGLAFEADVLRGQKTGFFLDQRDNRARVRERARGRTVLNVCSHAGGFSVYAAAGGATAVASLDISERALEGARRSFALNPQLARVPHETICGNAFDELPALARTGRRFDLVIVDPPSFAMRQADREGAIASYRTLNMRAAELVSAGGMLVSCSCSAHVDEAAFEEAVRSGLSRRAHRIVERTGHAVDHPVTFREGRYLKALWIELQGG